jgi:long-chain acyl-CoA synthetase
MSVMTPIESLYIQAGKQPGAPALLFEHERWSYQRLLASVEQLARALLRRGIRPGDRVVVHTSHGVQAAVTSLACLRMGAIVVPLSIRFGAEELRKLLERLQPSLYVGEQSRAQQVSGVEPAVLPGEARCFLGRKVTDELGLRWEDLFADADRGPLPDFPDRDAPAVLLVTSGTTAEPKLVVQTPSTLAHALKAYELLGTEGDAQPLMMTGTPLSHASGFVVTLLSLRLGTCIRVLPGFDAESCLREIEADRCTWFLGAPYMFAELVARQKLRPRDLTSLRFCLGAGDVCPPGLQQQVREVLGVDLRSAWGATEVMGSVLHGPPGSAGRCAPTAQIRLVDEQGEPVAAGEVGEFQVRGPNLSIGYWRAAAHIDSARPYGWFATGDLMRQDTTGVLWFVGRRKELIIRGGVNISPVEVETTLLSHPAVREAGATGAAHALFGEVVVAAVRLAESAGGDVVADVLRLAREQLADYKVPERLRVVTEIPRNGQGKIDRRALSRLLQAD